MMISETLVLHGGLLLPTKAFSCHKKRKYEKDSIIINVSGIIDDRFEAFGARHGVEDKSLV
jgi:hypothetical protein